MLGLRLIDQATSGSEALWLLNFAGWGLPRQGLTWDGLRARPKPKLRQGLPVSKGLARLDFRQHMIIKFSRQISIAGQL